MKDPYEYPIIPYDPDYGPPARIDTLYGTATTRPVWAVRLYPRERRPRHHCMTYVIAFWVQPWKDFFHRIMTGKWPE